MKKVIFFIIFALFTLNCFSQFPPMGGMPGGDGTMQAPPSIGVVFGKIVNSNGEPINGASVYILGAKMDSTTKKMKEILLKVQTTKANGNFRFESLPIVGQLTIKVSSVGFEAMEQKFNIIEMPKPGADMSKPPSFSSTDMEKDLGNISLVVQAKELQSITVNSTKASLKMDIDKKVFNVEKNIVSAGGTALDVMKNVPSVLVDVDGNVTLRNATPQLYVDGKPTTLSLDQIPADVIESVEVITNPSAKYDASGGNAGILNIVLKKNKRNGYNGNINVGVDKRGGINGGANLNIRQQKVNFSVSGFGSQMKGITSGYTDIKSLYTSPATLVNQTSIGNMNGGIMFGRAGVDIFATSKATFSLGVTKIHGSFNPHDVLNTDSLSSNGNVISYSDRNTLTSRNFNAGGFTAGYKQLFKKQGMELTADINSFSGKMDGDALYNTDFYNSRAGTLKYNTNQKIISSGLNSFTTIQSDFVYPLKGDGKIETGLRAQLRNNENTQGNYIKNGTSGEYMSIASSSSNYKNNDNVYAAYISITQNIKDFGYQIGLRQESSEYTGELTDTKKKFTNNYPLNLFPSVFLSQKLKNDQQVQFNYSRRVNRPFFMEIIPFIDSTDQLNWKVGNAGLKPEFTNSFEASYSKKFNANNNILASVYYKQTDNMITQYIDTISLNGGAKRPITTYINANNSYSIGAEFTSQNKITKWWDVNTNINFYQSKINTSNITNKSQDAMWSYFGKINNNLTLTKTLKLQVSGFYQSKTNLPVNQNQGMMGGPPPMGGGQSSSQGYIRSNWAVDLALQKSLFKNNVGSISLSVSDIFRTRWMNQYSESEFFIQNSRRISDAPMFRLNFSLKFGQMDMSLFKRKNMKGEMEGQQGAMQGIQ